MDFNLNTLSRPAKAPQPRERNTVKKLDMITTAADLLGDLPGQNVEYDSAILQMTAELLGMGTEDWELDALEIVLRAIK